MIITIKDETIRNLTWIQRMNLNRIIFNLAGTDGPILSEPTREAWNIMLSLTQKVEGTDIN